MSFVVWGVMSNLRFLFAVGLCLALCACSTPSQQSEVVAETSTQTQSIGISSSAPADVYAALEERGFSGIELQTEGVDTAVQSVDRESSDTYPHYFGFWNPDSDTCWSIDVVDGHVSARPILNGGIAVSGDVVFCEEEAFYAYDVTVGHAVIDQSVNVEHVDHIDAETLLKYGVV